MKEYCIFSPKQELLVCLHVCKHSGERFCWLKISHRQKPSACQPGEVFLRTFIPDVCSWPSWKTLFIVCTMICQRVITVRELFAKGKINSLMALQAGLYTLFQLQPFRSECSPIAVAPCCGQRHTHALDGGYPINFYCGLLRSSNEGHKFALRFFLEGEEEVNFEASSWLAVACGLSCAGQAGIASAAGLTARHGVTRHGVTQHGVTQHGMAWCSMAQHGVAWPGTSPVGSPGKIHMWGALWWGVASEKA